MATNTYVALKTEVISSSVSSITLSPIPEGYTDLVLVVNGRNGGGESFLFARFNNDTNANYSSTVTYAQTAFPTSTALRPDYTALVVGRTSSVPSTSIAHIQNYSKTTMNKTVICRSAAGTMSLIASALWRNASLSTITSITIFDQFGYSFQPGTSFTIYGIANSDIFTKATGGTITQDDMYTYHVFGSTGLFTPKQALTAEVLVVAGGGAGGAQGGGGGAGGLVYSSSISLGSGTVYTATVGAGGVAASGVPGTDGVASSLAGTGLTTISATGGGGGGSGNSGQNVNGRNGGSGGGGGVGGAATGGTGISGQGFAGGGAPGGGGNYPGGGGGGATQAGGTPAMNTYDAGNGGNGSSSYNAWGKATTMGESFQGTYYFAGGGGGGIFFNPLVDGRGGSGGYGGGTDGKGQGYIVANSKANTGGGGGGVGHPTLSLAGNGGSGVVIVRYPK